MTTLEEEEYYYLIYLLKKASINDLKGASAAAGIQIGSKLKEDDRDLTSWYNAKPRLTFVEKI